MTENTGYVVSEAAIQRMWDLLFDALFQVAAAPVAREYADAARRAVLEQAQRVEPAGVFTSPHSVKIRYEDEWRPDGAEECSDCVTEDDGVVEFDPQCDTCGGGGVDGPWTELWMRVPVDTEEP